MALRNYNTKEFFNRIIQNINMYNESFKASGRIEYNGMDVQKEMDMPYMGKILNVIK